MKTTAQLYLESELVNAVRAQAATLGVSHNLLIEQMLQEGLATDWTEWAAEVNAPKPARPSLRGSERTVLEVLSSEPKDYRNIRAESRLGQKVCWRAVKELEAKGFAQCVWQHEHKIMGIPINSRWVKV